MLATDAVTIAGVPPLLLAAYETDPGDWLLVDALSDAAAEASEYVVADCLKWVAAKKRQPYRLSLYDNRVGYGWTHTSNKPLSIAYLPLSVEAAYFLLKQSWAAYGDCARSVLLWRLTVAWAAATDSERQAAWAWQPPQ